MKEKVFLVRTTQKESAEYYVRAKNQKEAEQLVLKEQDEKYPTIYGEKLVSGCVNHSNFKITECKEMTFEEIAKALFVDDC